MGIFKKKEQFQPSPSINPTTPESPKVLALPGFTIQPGVAIHEEDMNNRARFFSDTELAYLLKREPIDGVPQNSLILKYNPQQNKFGLQEYTLQEVTPSNVVLNKRTQIFTENINLAQAEENPAYAYALANSLLSNSRLARYTQSFGPHLNTDNCAYIGTLRLNNNYYEKGISSNASNITAQLCQELQAREQEAKKADFEKAMQLQARNERKQQLATMLQNFSAEDLKLIQEILHEKSNGNYR